MNKINEWADSYWPRYEEVTADFKQQHDLKTVVGAVIPVGSTIVKYHTNYKDEYTPLNVPSPLYFPDHGPSRAVPKMTEEQEADLKLRLENYYKKLKQKEGVKIQKGTASRFNKGKRRWNLLPTDVLEPIVKVLEFGANKYAAWNFAEGDGLSWTEVLDSMKRHIMAWERGEDTDPESGESHLGHIGCNLMFLLYYTQYLEQYKSKDDRKKR